MTNREKLDRIKEVIGRNGLYEDFLDAINEVIGNTAYDMACDTGLDEEWIGLALNEMSGWTEEYTEEDIKKAIE